MLDLLVDVDETSYAATGGETRPEGDKTRFLSPSCFRQVPLSEPVVAIGSTLNKERKVARQANA
jgi:hypothetical protein